jgi:hypothetical protein
VRQNERRLILHPEVPAEGEHAFPLHLVAEQRDDHQIKMVWESALEFRQLRYFVAVAEEENLTAAARKLHVSQPPITRQIRQLEEELRVELLVRSSKGVQLTEAGKLFFAEAKRLLNIGRAAVEKARAAQAGEVGRWDIGYSGPRSGQDLRLAKADAGRRRCNAAAGHTGEV